MSALMKGKDGLSDDEKRRLYREGRYVFRAPDVCHAQWDDTDWMNWITACGGWRPDAEKVP